MGISVYEFLDYLIMKGGKVTGIEMYRDLRKVFTKRELFALYNVIIKRLYAKGFITTKKIIVIDDNGERKTYAIKLTPNAYKVLEKYGLNSYVEGVKKGIFKTNITNRELIEFL